MNIETALEKLNLDKQATPETIEKTYRKLINRYPPEFHPEKFRQIDEAYRFLTSFARRVEMLFSPQTGELKLNMDIFSFRANNSPTLLEGAGREIKRLERLRFLWENS